MFYKLQKQRAAALPTPIRGGVVGGVLTAAKPKIQTPPPTPPLQGRGEEDEWDSQDTSDQKPYTLDELYARIQESHDQYLRGEYYAEEESREMLKKEFPWLT